MNKWIVLALAALLLAPLAQAENAAHRIGLGANYWFAIDDIEVDDIDEDGFSYLVSYQYRPTLIGFQADFEYMDDLYNVDAFAPAAYLIIGKAIYAAAGVGIVNFDGGGADDPFFAFKAGLDLELLPSIVLDVSASYRFNAKTDLDDAVHAIDTDTVFLGAAARIGF